MAVETKDEISPLVNTMFNQTYNQAIDHAVRMINLLKNKGWHDPKTALEFAAEQIESLKKND